MNKITEQWIDNKIRKVDYTVIPGSSVTICSIQLENGYRVQGEAACVAPENFDEELGQKYAYKAAYDKIWALEGYLLAEGLWIQRECPEVRDFGWALNQAKKGKKVAREGWNGKGMWITVSPGAKDLRYANFWAEANRNFASKRVSCGADVLPCITMKTADDKVLMGWLASQTDMLSEDWVVVE